MKLSIEGTPEEIKNALLAICGSEEREEMIIPMNKKTRLNTSHLIQETLSKLHGSSY